MKSIKLSHGIKTAGPGRKFLCAALASALILPAADANAQTTIEECIRLARENYPQTVQMNLIEEAAKYDIASVSKNWLPHINIAGKASYQSDVVEMPFEIPGFEFDIPHDQYSLTGEISQTIWDGGASKSQKEVIRSGAEVQKNQLEVSLYSLTDRVTKIYLGILLIDEQIRQNRLVKESLSRNEATVLAGMENGISFKSDLDMIKVSMLNCDQQEFELQTGRKAYVQMLGKLTGKEMDSTDFTVPGVEYENPANEITRPELALYDARTIQEKALLQQLNSKISPKFNLSLQGGIGRPGLNMLSGEFQPYYVAGIKMQWDLGALYTRKDEKRKIDAELRQIESDRETFLFNTELEMTDKKSEIEKARGLLERDREITGLRESIRKSGEEQYRNGTISMTDLMERIDDEHDARITESIHRIQLLMAIYDLKNSAGYFGKDTLK